MTIGTILAMDVGGGTQDVLVFDPTERIENSVKLVLPSPTVMAARRIEAVTRSGRALFLSGRVMGGGCVSRAIRGHLKAGFPVFSLPDPALTLHDNLGKVASMGLEIVEAQPDGAAEVRLGDLEIGSLKSALAMFEVPWPDRMAVALQDHGFSPDFSNRLTRFRQWRRFLESGGDVGGLLFSTVPEGLTRWAAAAAEAPGALFMDTASAALRGAMLDVYAAQRLDEGLLAINVGNEHTVAFLVRDRAAYGVYEHHTSLVNPSRLADHMDRFAAGALTHEEVFGQWGHGLAYRPEYLEMERFRHVVVTGPNRALAAGLGHMAAPHGDMMLSGCFGLIEAVLESASGPAAAARCNA